LFNIFFGALKAHLETLLSLPLNTYFRFLFTDCYAFMHDKNYIKKGFPKTELFLILLVTTNGTGNCD